VVACEAVPHPRAASQPAGTSVAHYRIVRVLGSGAMGQVYLARDARLGRLVALKFLSPDMLDSPEVRRQFDVEARTTASLSHPNVVTLFDVGEHEGRPWVALEYLEGSTLAQRMAQDWPGAGESLRVGVAIARAIEAAHAAGVLHRDLKPANVLLATDGRPRVLDFGIARFVARDDDAPASQQRPMGGLDDDTVQFLGTPPYMAPEQWRREDTPATDVWALGLILYELLSRRHPLKGLDIGQIALRASSDEPIDPPPEFLALPTELAALVMRCLQKAPGARPTAAELREGLEAIEARQRAAMPAETPFRGLSPFTERHADLFFGREREVTAFVERMRTAAVLLVVGPSGAGKSSFVRAGVLPRLAETGNWHVILVRPEARPLAALAAAVARLAASIGPSSVTDDAAATVVERPRPPPGTPRPSADSRDIAQRLLASPALLAVVLGEIAAKTAARVLLVVDQLEEVYTLAGDEGERRAFVDAVCAAAADPDEPVRVVMTVRDDFLGRVPWGASARVALAGVSLLPPPEPDALREIVTRPLARFGYAFDDPALLEEMIASVRGEVACLPLLQFAMSRLWARREEGRRLLLRSAYDAMGAVGGALATHAEDVVGVLPPDRLEIARHLLLRLVTREGTRRVVARAALLDGLAPEAAEVLARLLDARLLVEQRSDEGGVGLAHESLTRVWRRLARWVEASQEDLSLAADLAEAAERWARRGRRDDELWTGDALRDALRLRARGGTPLPPGAVELVDRSRRRADRQARARRALLGSLVAVALLAAAASSMAAWAWRARQREASAAAARAEDARALLLEERALASFADEDHRSARAQLRSALEARDSVPLRNLARRLLAEPRLFFLPEPDVVYDARLIDDGRSLLSGHQGGSVELHDPETLARRVLRGHTDQAIAVAPLPGGRAVSVSLAGEVRVWDLARGEGAVLFPGTAGALALTASGAQVAVSTGGEIVVLDADGARPPRHLDPGIRHAPAIAFGAGERVLYAGGASGTVVAVDRESGELLRRSQAGDAVLRLAVGPGGRFVASAHRDGTLALWDPTSLALRLRVRAHAGEVRALAVGADGRVWTAGTDHRVAAWDPSAGAALAELPTRLATVVSLSVAPDGRVVAAGNGGIEAWSAAVPAHRAPVAPHDEAVVNLAWSPDGKQIASVSSAAVLLWDVASGRPVAALRRGGLSAREIAFDASGRSLAATDQRGTLEIWELPSRRSLGPIGPYLPGPNGLVYDAARDLAVVGALDGILRVYQPSEKRLVRELRGHAAGIHALALAPDGRTLYSASIDGTVRAWDLRTGEGSILDERSTRVQGLALSADGATLVSVDSDGVAARIDPRTRARTVLGRFPGRLYNVALDPSGRTAALACSDGNAYLVDLATLASRALRGHRREVNGVAWSADGRLVATAGDDHTVRVFDAATGKPVWGEARADDPRRPAPGAEAGVTASLQLGDRLAVGFDNGTVELRARRGERAVVVALRDTPTGAAAVIAPGPAGTLVVGFEDGFLGVWDPETGRLLERAHLHGSVVEAGADGAVVTARSELGDRARLDLAVLGRSYCELLRDVWVHVPVVWRDGAAQVEPPPATHRCR
jgi:WD40 repeat protein